MKKLQAGIVFAKILGLIPTLFAKVMEVMPDGVTADEAEALALAALQAEDVKITIRGIDVLDDRSEDLLTGFVARIARNVIAAATAPKE